MLPGELGCVSRRNCSGRATNQSTRRWTEENAHLSCCVIRSAATSDRPFRLDPSASSATLGAFTVAPGGVTQQASGSLPHLLITGAANDSSGINQNMLAAARMLACRRPPFFFGFLASAASDPELSDESESLESESLESESLESESDVLLLSLLSESLLSLESESLLPLLSLSLEPELESESLLSSELLELKSESELLLLLLLSESELVPLSESEDEAVSAFRFRFFLLLLASGLTTVSDPFRVASFSRSSGSRSLGSRYRRVCKHKGTR